MRTAVRYYFEAISVFLLVILAAPVCAEHLPVKIYTSADGLGSSFVDYLTRDSRGFMWFCTRDGLSRFDGSQFTTYQLSGENAAPGFENISETSKGLYFVSTTGGLFYFDQNTVSRAHSDTGARPVLNAKFASGNRGYVLEDHAGDLWFGTVGLFRLTIDDNGVKLDPVDLHLPEKYANSFAIIDIFEANDYSLWMTTNLGIIRRLPDGRVVLYATENSVNQNSISVMMDGEGRIWMTKVREFRVFIPESAGELAPDPFTLRSSTPTNVIKLTPDSDISLPEKAGQVFQYSEGDDDLLHTIGAKLYRSSDGTVWLTTDHGLYRFERNTVRFASTEQGLLPSLVRMAEDPAGNIWFGGTSGVMRLDRKGLISYGPADGLNSPSIAAINEDRDGRLYFANGTFFVSQFDGKRFETVKPAMSSEARILWTSRFSFIDSGGEWWILSQLGLNNYSPVSNFKMLNDAKPAATYGVGTGFTSNGMFQIFEDSKGTIWVSTQSSGPRTRGLASKKAGENLFHTYTEDEGYPGFHSASSFAEGSDGSLWFGFYEGGVVRYRDEKFTTMPEKDLPNGLVSDLLFDSSGRLWLASALGGLYICENPTDENPVFHKVITGDSLQSQNIRTLVDDTQGNIYAGTVRGIDRVSPDLRHVKHYSVNDGLASDFVVDSHRDRTGTLWFATTNGLSKLMPAATESITPPPVWIGGLRIAGVEQDVSALGETQIKTDDLFHTQNNFEIDYYGLDFRAGERLRYQYKLEGADSDWSPSTEQRQVTYANLQPGSYRFLVRSVNSDGLASEVPAAVTFKILSPIWARWWFVTIAALVIGLFVVGFYRYRIDRLREVNEALLTARNAEANLRRSREERLAELESVRTRIATDLHDDIGASLTQIAVLSEVARTQSGAGNGNAAAPLIKISAVTNELVETMSDIVWSINPAKDHLSDLTQRMRRFASDVLSSRDIRINFRVPPEANKIVIKGGFKREVFLVFKEAVNNIAKHSDATRVEIDLDVNIVEFNLNISDDGKGFDIDQMSETDGGNGLLSMRRRAEAVNGSVTIISAPGSGTRIALALPLEQTISP